MKEKRLKELVPDLDKFYQIEVDNFRDSKNGDLCYSSRAQKQTDNLRKAINKLIDITGATKNYCIDVADNSEEGKMLLANSDYSELVKLIEQITGVPFSEIGDES